MSNGFRPRIYGAIHAFLPLRKRLPAQLRMPQRALQIWYERPDLRSAFDLSKTSGREGLAKWYLRHAFSELGLPFDPADDACLLAVNQPLPKVRHMSFLPITWLMRVLMDPAKAVLADAQAQERLLCNFFSTVLSQANALDFLSEDQAAILRASSPNTPGVPQILVCLWTSTPHLQDRFSGVDDPRFLEWCAHEGAREFPILAHPLIALAKPPIRQHHTAKPFGVNLFGHGGNRSGISEDLRMAIEVLRNAEIPFKIFDTAPCENNEGIKIHQKHLPYSINIFAMTAESTAGVVSSIGKYRIADHYNIGFWPWELPEVPEFWRHAYDAMDEIWASSRFTYDAFARSSPRKVRHVPFAITAQETGGKTRSDFGLPSAPFLFGFAFDGLSSFARKSPLSVIAAFEGAFPRDDKTVGLVIKGMRAVNSPQWNTIKTAADQDDRIHLLTDSWPRGILLDLWRSLDCFVSLHRSEGFGRVIAEAMLLEKPVIVTGHSGNMDFTQYANAAIVRCKLKSVEQGEYPYSAGQLWAEPEIEHASGLMQKIVSQATWRNKIGKTGKDTISNQYAPNAVGKEWKSILHGIYYG